MRPENHFTLVTFALIALAGLGLVLVGVPSASAATVDETGTSLSTWDEDNGEWELSPDTPRIPLNGTYLVEVGATQDTNADQFQEFEFRFTEQNTENAWVQYEYTVDSDGIGSDISDPEDRKVFCPAQVNVAGDSQLATSGGECDFTASQDTWFFLIDTSSEPEATGSDASELTDGTNYNLEITVDDGESTGSLDTADTDHSTIRGEDVTTDVSTSPSFTPNQAETGLEVELTMEISNEGSTGSGSSGDPGTVQAYVCLMVPGSGSSGVADDRAYPHYEPFNGSAGDIANDETDDLDCEHPVVPREWENTKDPITGDVIPRGQQVLDNADGSEIRYYNFTIDELFDDNGDPTTDVTEFEDEFYLRVVLRDDHGNLVTENFHEDSDNEEGPPGPFTIRSFDAGLNVTEVGLSPDAGDFPSAQRFEDNNGCFQQDQDGDGFRETEPFGDGGDNDRDVPCLRSRDHAPPDQAIDVPVTLENNGNVEDTIDVSTQHRDGERWDVQLVDTKNTVDTSDDEVVSPPLQVSVPAADSEGPGEHDIKLRFVPDSDSVAEEETPALQDSGEGFETVRLRVQSEETNVDPAPKSDRFVQGQLVTDRQGELTLGADRKQVATVEAGPSETKTVSLKFNNSGNTDGPFTFGMETGDSEFDAECRGFNQAEQSEDVNLRLLQSGSETNDVTVSPGSSQSFTVEVSVGRDVSIGTYDCVIDVEESGNGVTLSPVDPTVRVEVTGVTDLQVFRTSDDADRVDVNLTGKRTNQLASAEAGAHTVVFYLENTGNVPIEPRLDRSTFELLDEQDLGGTWKGIRTQSSSDKTATTSGSEMDLSTAGESFTVPVTDPDDRPRVDIRDIFDEDGSVVDHPDVEDDLPGESATSQWNCAGRDSGADTDEDEFRVLCRLEFEFQYADDNAVIGDHVVYDFEWVDTEAEGEPANATVDLDFQHPGQVVADSVSQSVVNSGSSGPGQTSRVVFEGRLDEGRTFDTDENELEADVTVESKDSGATFCSDEGTVSSSSFNATVARFPVEIQFTQSGDCISNNGDNVWTLQADGVSRTAVVNISVTDEDGDELRQVVPAHVRSTGSSSTVDEPSVPTGFQVEPNRTMPANGSQYARVTFETGDSSFIETQGLQADEGIVVSRADEGEDLSPYTRCGLEGRAVSTDDDTYGWTRIAPGDTDQSPELNEDEAIAANTDGIQGVLFREGNNDQAVGVGQIELFGWGDGDGITWHEGWNPLVLRIEDASGDVVSPPSASNAPELDVTLKFGVRNASGFAHSFEISSEEDAIPVEALGQGYYRAHVYLPEGLPTVSNDRTEEYGSNPQLSDHPREDSGDVALEAWGLRATIDSGESVRGQDVSGDAYWRIDQIGLADGSPSNDAEGADNGTVAPSAIREGSGTRTVVTQTETDTQLEDDPHDSSRTFAHTSLRFLGGPLGPQDDWPTGPGTHQVGVFALEESDEGQRSTEQIEDDENTAKPFHRHTFQPLTDASGSMVLSSLGRSGLLSDGTSSINSVSGTDGLYDTLVRFPDTGNTLNWLGEIVMTGSDGNRLTPSNGLVFDFEVDPEREPASNGIPMPLCVKNPAGQLDRTDDAGDFDVDTTRNEVILDLRSIPGMRPDRLDFSFAPAIQSSSDGVRLLDDNTDLYPDSQFTIEAPGQVDLDPSLLPGSTETGRDLDVRVPADGPVGKITARLGPTTDPIAGPVELTDDDRDGTYTGDLTIEEGDEGNHTLTVKARDKSGGVSTLEQTLDVRANTAPQISVLSPTGSSPSMPDNGTITFAVDDASIDSLTESTLRENINISREQNTSGGADLDGDPLEGDRVNVTGIDSRVETGSTATITVNVTNETGDPVAGTAHVNLSDGGHQFNGTLTDGELEGDVTFPGSAGDVDLTVELNGTDGISETFTVTVVDPNQGGTEFQPVDSSRLEYRFLNSTVEVSYDPDTTGVTEITARATAELPGEDPADPREITVSLDGTAPTLSVSFEGASRGSNPTIVGGSTTVRASAQDADTGVSQIRLEADQNGTETVTVSSGSLQATISRIGITPGQTVDLTVTATDGAGNTASETRSVRIDDSPPSISGVTAQAADGQVGVSAQVTDDSGVGRVLVFHQAPGDSSFSDTSMTRQGGSFQATIDECGDPGGTLEFYVQATDQVGNQATDGSRNSPNTFDLATVECPEPSVTITSPRDGETVSGQITIELDTTPPLGDGAEIDSFTLTDSEGTEQSFSTAPANVDTSSLAEGEATIAVTVTARGEQVSHEVTVTIAPSDGTGPGDRTVDVDNPEGSVSMDQAPDSVRTSMHPNATQIRVVITQDGRELSNETYERNEDGTFSIPALADGTYEITVTQTDDEGRTVKTSSTQLVVGPVSKPTGRLVTTLVLGAAVAGSAAYAAFGRWS